MRKTGLPVVGLWMRLSGWRARLQRGIVGVWGRPQHPGRAAEA